MLGLIAGVIVFAEIYTAIAAFVWSGSLESATLAELLGLPFWLLAALVVVMALGTFWLVRRLGLKAGRQAGGAPCRRHRTSSTTSPRARSSRTLSSAHPPGSHIRKPHRSTPTSYQRP